jgi:drug/metabolite transporter (DMT)-like permease
MTDQASPEPSAGGTARHTSRELAIALMIAAVTLFSALDTSAKYLINNDHIPVTQVVWMRFLVQFVALLVLVPLAGTLSLPQLFKTSVPGWQLVRSILMVATTIFNFLALEFLQLDQTVTVAFMAPLMVALLAGPLLGEWVGWRRMVAIVVGLVGILIAMRPGTGAVHPAIIYSVLAMLAYALFMLLTRHIASADPPMVTLFYSMFAGTFLGAPIALADWISPSSAAMWMLLLILGALGGLGHWLFLHAYRLAPASSIAPFLYMQLISMVGFGYAVFGHVPDQYTLIGAAIVVASGIYLVHRERVTNPIA